MSNTPIPSPTTTAKAINLDRVHLALAGVVLAASLFVGYEIISRQADRADAKFSAAQAAAQASDRQNSAIQQQIASQIAALAQENQRLENAVLTLSQAIAHRDSALTVQTTSVPRLAPTDLGNQWGAVATEPPPQLDLSGAFLVPVPLAQKSLVALLTVPVLTQDKGDLQKIVDTQRGVITNDVGTLSAERESHLSDNLTCKSDKQALTAQIDKVKKDARRGKIRSFLYGAGVGAGITVAIVVKYF